MNFKKTFSVNSKVVNDLFVQTCQLVDSSTVHNYLFECLNNKTIIFDETFDIKKINQEIDLIYQNDLKQIILKSFKIFKNYANIVDSVVIIYENKPIASYLRKKNEKDLKEHILEVKSYSYLIKTDIPLNLKIGK